MARSGAEAWTLMSESVPCVFVNGSFSRPLSVREKLLGRLDMVNYCSTCCCLDTASHSTISVVYLSINVS